MNDAETVILVVDDNEDNRYTLARRMKREGYANVRLARDGREALEFVDRERIDLVLLDVMMPGVNGFEVLERMRESGRLHEIPVIMVSALDEMDAVVRCIELGAEDYLPKPINSTLLRARIRAVLEKKRLRDDLARQLEFIRDVFGKYVPAGVARRIVAEGGELAPTHRVATILYTDIEAFTAVVESMEPARVVQMLNEYFPAVLAPVRRHGGVVNQFQGDAMLVTFNVPLEDPLHADQAIGAALEIRRVVEERTFAGVRLPTRIGINTGQVIAGNVGSGDRMTYTVHGDAVNVAARLEQLNKNHGTRLLVSGTTVAAASGDHGLDFIGTVPVRGKAAAVDLYTKA